MTVSYDVPAGDTYPGGAPPVYGGADPYSYGAATPRRALAGAAGGGFTYAASSFQQDTAQIAAAARVTHQPLAQLDAQILALSRDFPIGQRGAIATVAAVEQLGLSARNQVPQVAALSKEMIELAGATGTAPAAIATGFGQLNRQLASLDPSRVGRFADVLTTLTARGGGNASGILDFSRQIAPIAQQAGLGESAVLGISSAFTKLGDDGYAAATAVNRILGDLNASVREGTNQMAAYAQVTGMTVHQFKALYEANPAQALTQVTEAIGRAGPRGQTMLAGLGLGDSVRTQRALLELAQSGGLGAQVNMAVGAYGSGATRQAAQAAYGGLLDAGVKLESNFTALATVTGAPLLRPFTAFTNLLSSALHPLEAIAGSGPAQRLLGGAAEVGGVALLLRRVLGVGTTLATGEQLRTSGIARGLVGGFLVGRRGEEAALGGRFGGYISPVLDEGARRSGFLGPANNFAFNSAQTLGAFFSRRSQGGRPFGPLGAASLAWEAAMNATAAPFRLASARYDLRSDIAQNLLTGAPGGAVRTAGAGIRGAFGGLLDEADTRSFRDRFAEARGAVRDFRTEVASSSRGLRVLNATLAAGGAVGRFAGGGLLSAGRLALGPLLSPAGLALGGAVGGYELYQHVQGQRAAEGQRIQSLFDPGNSVRNRYNDALGLASENTTTFADTLDSSARRVATAATSLSQAMHVSATDQRAAAGQKPVVTFTGSTRQVASQVAASFASGITPTQATRVKQDLLSSGYSTADVQTIMAAAIRQVGTGKTGLTGREIAGSIGAAETAEAGYHPSQLHSFAGLQGAASNALQYVPGVNLIPGIRSSGAGAGLAPIEVNTPVKNAVDTLAANVTSQFNQISTTSGATYAVQWLFRTVNSIMGQYSRGSADVFAYASKVFSRLVTSLGAKTGGKTAQTSEIDFLSGGGDYIHYLQTHGANTFGGKPLSYWTGQGVAFTGTGVKASSSNNQIAGELAGQGAAAYAGLYGGSGANVPQISTSAQKLFAAAQQGGFNAPGPTAAAAQAFVNSAMGRGVNPGQLATQSYVAGSLAPEDANFQSVVQQLAQAAFARRVAGMTMPQQLQATAGQAITGISSLAGVDTQDAQNQRLAYQQVLDGVQSDERSYYQQRLQAQFNFEVQSRRANEDYQRSISRETADFHRQVTRQQQDAAKTLYDPYQRIQVQPVYDAANLLLNEGEQLTAMRTQLANIRKLRGLGLTEATIRQLSLYDPSKAQQTAELVMDLSSDQADVGRFNRMTSARQQAGARLLSQDPQFQRQRQDFLTAMARQRQDHQTQLDRMAEDLHNADLQITGDLQTLQRDFNRVMNGQQVDFSKVMKNTWRSTLDAAHHFGPLINAALAGKPTTGGHSGGATVSSGVTATGSITGGGYGNAPVGGTGGQATRIDTPGMHSTLGSSAAAAPSTSYVRPGTGGVYHGAMHGRADTANANYKPTAAFMTAHPADPDFNRSIAKRMAPGWAHGKQWAAWNKLWDNESGWSQYADNPTSSAYGIAEAIHPEDMARFGKDWRTNPATQIAWGIYYIGHHIDDRTGKPYGDPLTAWSHEVDEGWYHAGSIFTRPTRIGVGDGGPEAVLPLDAHGAAFLARTLQSYLGADDAGMLATARSSITIGTLHNEYHYDQGVHFDGDVNVYADSPEEFAAKAQAMRRRSNLTGARGVAWSRTS